MVAAASIIRLSIVVSPWPLLLILIVPFTLFCYSGGAVQAGTLQTAQSDEGGRLLLQGLRAALLLFFWGLDSIAVTHSGKGSASPALYVRAPAFVPSTARAYGQQKNNIRRGGSKARTFPTLSQGADPAFAPVAAVKGRLLCAATRQPLPAPVQAAPLFCRGCF